MTQTARHSSPAQVSPWRGPARRDQLFFSILGVVLLVCAALTQAYMRDLRGEKRWDLVREDPDSEKRLATLGVTIPRLTFGGMRGIASTVLWMEAEDDKNNRKWFDLETKYDQIGALQPYFSSVYIFHSWNQAYNLSAQWQEEDIKYKWVLDGLSYLYKGEDFNPGNPDIYMEEALLYSLKLGSAAERVFYSQHWRNDQTRLHEIDKIRKDGGVVGTDDAAVSLQHVYDIINRRDSRDHSNYFHIDLLPNPDAPTGPYRGWGISISDPRDISHNPDGFNLFKDRTDGKPATAPVEFRYGVSPFYFAYIEYERTLALPIGPTYTGLRVTHSWPAMSLRLWCRDDMYYTYNTMRHMFGKNPQPALLEPKVLAAKADEIHDCYRNVEMIGPRAIDLFVAHLQKYPEDRFIHPKHMEEVKAFMVIAKAEIKLFDTLVQWQIGGRKMDDDFKKNLLEADQLYKDALPTTETWVNTVYPAIPGEPANPDRADFEQYVDHLKDYSKGIETILSLPAGQNPDLSFLEEEVVEK
jgi:hypothetical protein